MPSDPVDPQFDPATLAHAIIANRLMIRRGNPSMSGPGPKDFRNAADLIDELESHGLRVVAEASC